MKFVIQGTFPDLNEVIRLAKIHWGQYYQLKKVNTTLVKYKCHHLPTVTKKVIVKITWIAPNKRKDPDNIAFAKKYVLDGLVEAGVLPKDGWKNISGFVDCFDVDRKNPRIEVELLEGI